MTVITLAGLLEKISLLEGKALKNKEGASVRSRTGGRPRKIKANTVTGTKSQLKGLVRDAKIDTGRGFMAGMRDWRRVIQEVRAMRWKIHTLKSRFSAVISAAKYVPEFKGALGEEAYEQYHRAMMDAIKEGEDDSRTRTESAAHAIMPLSRMRELVASMKGRVTPLEYISAFLQVHVYGFRDNLGSVELVKTKAEGMRRKLDKFYGTEDGALHVAVFKTDDQFPPYDFKVSDAVKRAVDDYLKTKAGIEYLAGKGPRGPTVKRAFFKVGAEVNILKIRHAQVVEMVGAGPTAASEANINRVAAVFKHSPEMTSRYIRVTSEEGEGENSLSALSGDV